MSVLRNGMLGARALRTLRSAARRAWAATARREPTAWKPCLADMASIAEPTEYFDRLLVVRARRR